MVCSLMTDFVGDDHRHFVLIGSVFDDPTIHKNHAARGRARIQRSVTQGNELPHAYSRLHLITDFGGRSLYTLVGSAKPQASSSLGLQGGAKSLAMRIEG